MLPANISGILIRRNSPVTTPAVRHTSVNAFIPIPIVETATRHNWLDPNALHNRPVRRTVSDRAVADDGRHCGRLSPQGIGGIVV